MAYWGSIFRRALREAAKDLKLDTWATGITSMAVQAIVSAGLFFGLGQLEGPTLLTRVVTAAAPFFALPIATFVRMFTVPAAVAGEQAAKLATLSATNSTPKYAINIAAMVDIQVMVGDMCPVIGRIVISNTQQITLIASNTLMQVTVNDGVKQVRTGNSVLIRSGQSFNWEFDLGKAKPDEHGTVKFIVTVTYGHSEGNIDRSVVREILSHYAVKDNILESRSSTVRDIDSALPNPSDSKAVL